MTDSPSESLIGAFREGIDVFPKPPDGSLPPVAPRAMVKPDSLHAALARTLEALILAQGVRHDMDGHRKRYVECDVPGCVEEIAAVKAARGVLNDNP